MPKNTSTKALGWAHYITLYFGLVLLTGLIYHTALHIAWLEDDYQWLFVDPRAILFGCFTHVIGPDNHWYRPFMAMILSAIQIFWGSSTLPIHLFVVLAHAAIALLIYRILRDFGINFVPAILASVYFSISQNSSFIVMSNDTISQLGNSAFGALTLWLIYRADLGGGIRASWKYILCSLATFMLALVSKETSAGLILSVGLLLLLKQSRFVESIPRGLGTGGADASEQRMLQRAWNALRWAIPFALCMGVYLLLRTEAGATPPNLAGGAYGFHFGLNVLKNAAMFAGQSVMPVSSLAIMKAFYYKQNPSSILLLGGSGAFLLLFAAFAIYGMVKSGLGRTSIVLAALACFGLVPAIFLPHVSEAYLYNALPFVAVIMGFSIEYYWQLWAAGKRTAPAAAALVFFAAVVSNGWGAISKTAAMKLDADHSEILLPQIRPWVAELPLNGYLYLVHPVKDTFEYSVFTERGFRILNCTDLWLKRWTGRNDVSIMILDSDEYLDSVRKYSGTAVTYDPKTMVVRRFD